MLRIWLHISQAIVWGIHILFHSDVSERHIKAPRGLLLLNIGLSLLNLPGSLRIIQIRFAILTAAPTMQLTKTSVWITRGAV